jgi:ABC-type transport system substrate-binding protein
LYKFLFINVVLFSLLVSGENKYLPIEYRVDDASSLAISKRLPNSHIKIYLPSIPYSYIMRLINGTLVRLNSSSKGWEYFLAQKHEKVNPLTYDFWLRKDVKFQDGTPFDADSVIENFAFFQKGAFTYTDIHHKLKSVEKLGKYKIRIHLNKPYGMLLNDLARINLYTTKYLKKYAWTNNIVGVNTKAPGPYGCGPYILASGYATGLKLSKKIVLKANPYYFKQDQPYIQTITIYTKLHIKDVIHKITEEEGALDIAVIPMDKKTEIVNSPYAKLVSTVSSYNFSIHMNLMNPLSKLQNQEIRQALNQALNQKKLIKFAYKNEGTISPFPLSSNSYYAKNISQKYIKTPKIFFSQEKLKRLLNGLHLKVVTQDRFLSLWKGIEYQLNNYGVVLDYDITTDETYVLNKLLTNRKNSYDWDLLIWGNGDWYGHPWTTFFTLYTKNQWSAIKSDDILDKKIQRFFEEDINSLEFQSSVNDILEYTYQKAYMLSVPSPNILLALNKEVLFLPSSVAILRLWEAKLTPYHWSIRKNKKLPKGRKSYIYPKRINYDE